MMSKEFLEHVVKATSQYDSLCRELAAEVLKLRQDLDARVQVSVIELDRVTRHER